jgi:peptide/nickel transport system substrate-binding protein
MEATSRLRLQRAPTLLAVSLVLATSGILASGQAAGAAGTGATLTVGWGSVPANVDPAITTSQNAESIDVNIFQTLIWQTPAGKLTPDLATSWKTSKSDLTHTFTLRKGVTFQDGTPFNAAAVVANVQYITNKTTGSVVALEALGSCTSATALSTYTVQLTCTTPYGPLLSNLTIPAMGMQSPASISNYGSNLQFHMVGTGPFELVSYTPNTSLVLKRYPQFDWPPPALHQSGAAKVGGLVYDFVPNDGSRISELLSSQAQVIEGTPTAYYGKLQHNKSYTDLAVPISGMGWFIQLDAAKFPTNSAAVRQAISYFINRPAALKTALQSAYPEATTPLQPGILGYDPKTTQYKYDPAKGDSLLKANGWQKSGGVWTKDGLPLNLALLSLSTTQQTGLMLQAVQSQLSTAGIKSTIVTEALVAYESTIAANGANAYFAEYANPDPAQLLQFYVPGNYFDTWTHVNNSALTKLLESGQVTSSSAQRAVIYAKVQQIIMQEAYEIPFHLNNDLLTMSSKVTGVEYEGGGYDFFYQADVAK